VAAQRSHRVPRNNFISLETPETPDNYNLQDAWTDDQAENMDEEGYHKETAEPSKYQSGAWNFDLTSKYLRNNKLLE